MAFTSSDLTAVETAIRALITGERAVTVKIGEKTVTYQETDLKTLRELRGMIQKDIALANGGKRSRHAVTDKGY